MSFLYGSIYSPIWFQIVLQIKSFRWLATAARPCFVLVFLICLNDRYTGPGNETGGLVSALSTHGATASSPMLSSMDGSTLKLSPVVRMCLRTLALCFACPQWQAPTFLYFDPVLSHFGLCVTPSVVWYVGHTDAAISCFW